MSKKVNRIKSVSFALLYIGIYYASAFSLYHLFYFRKKAGGATVVQIENEISENLYVINILVCFLSLAIYYLIGRIRKKKLSMTIKREKCLPIIYFMSVSLALGCRFLVSVYYFIAQRINVLEQSIENAGSVAPESPQLIISVICAVVVAPCFEEILFRGLVMGELSEVLRPWVAVTLQAMLFGIAHGILFQSLFAFAVGIALGIVYYNTGSIKTVILCHIVFNFSAILTQEELSLQGMYVYALFGILLCALSMFYIIINSRKR